MDSEEKIKQDWATLENNCIEQVCELLRCHEIRIQDYLADCVAAICGIDKSDMMTNVSKMSVVHSRWLFWYAYRYMSNEPFIRIAEITHRYGRRFTEQSISCSVNKMGNMIANETIWTKRWVIIRRIIKIREEIPSNGQETIMVTVHHPKNVEVKLKMD